MGDIKGFLKVKRQIAEYRPVCERVKDFYEVCILPEEGHSKEQASRCMDCGTPFCHWGCPVGNYIPEWNDLVFRGHWHKAFQLLDATNNLPEITGRVCPAMCEYGCVLGINDEPVTIRENELAIIEYAFKKGYIKPRPPKKRTRKRIAVVGSGPAGLSCADQLNRAGHNVVVFEKDDRVGGILRYGIPDFKLEKWVIDRRVNILKKEGIEFRTGVFVGMDYKASQLKKEFDAICLAGGCRVPRDLNIEGRSLKGIYFAMDYLVQGNKRVQGKEIPREGLIDGSASPVRLTSFAQGCPERSRRTLTINPERAKRVEWIDAKGKQVVIIGAGDTGADCVGLAHRQGASCVVQIELLPRPPECRSPDMPWPKYPMLLKTSTSHQEGAERKWQVLTKKFVGEKGEVKKLSCVKVDGSTQPPSAASSVRLTSFAQGCPERSRRTLTINPERFDFVQHGSNRGEQAEPQAKRVERIEFSKNNQTGCPAMKEVKGSGFEIDADLVILAMGFLRPEQRGLIQGLGLELDPRGNVKADENFMTSKKGIFSAGDMHRGQSLIVWAISEGRKSACHIDKFLMGKTNLPIT